MAGNRDLILAGVKGGGAAGNTLANFAPTGTPLPSTPTATLNVAFEDAGWCSEDGLKKVVNESIQTIKGFGTLAPLRKLITSSETEFELTFLESNTTAIEVYQRLPLGTLVPTAGAFDFTEGLPVDTQYSAVFDLIDGANRIRAVVPQLSVTGRKEFNIKAADPVSYGVTLTAYPGSDGVAIHWYYIVAGVS